MVRCRRSVAARLVTEEIGEKGGRSLLELVVAAVGRRAIGAPATERGGMPEAVALEVIEGDLAHELGANRLP